jgi:hypothetical protein
MVTNNHLQAPLSFRCPCYATSIDNIETLITGSLLTRHWIGVSAALALVRCGGLSYIRTSKGVKRKPYSSMDKITRWYVRARQVKTAG